METKKKHYYKQTGIALLVCIFMWSLTTTVGAQQASLPKTIVKPIDPASIALTEPTLFIVPYSHLDDMWRWSYPQTIRDFLKSTLDENFEAFEEYPNYVFNWSGASRYQMMREYYPEKYEELKEWVDAGRWHPSGSSWVENDVNVPSTESVVRQILMGTQYFKNEFGKESREFMLPDCFGFPYSLPSVLNHCGIRGFSTQKLTWGSANGIPFNVGRWIGPDGESVIAALNAGNYASPHPKVYSTDKEILQRLEDNKKKSGLPIDFFYMGGGDKNNADRGGVIQKVSLETLKADQETEGPVKVVAGKADLMFTAITDEQAVKLPTHNKDLLLIQHSTGVLTSQAYTKKLNRDAELLADASERAALAAHLLIGAEYPYGALNHAWGLTLRNQFHDNLPGTSIPKAYEYAWNDGIVALNQFAGIYKDAIGSLAKLLHTDVPGLPVVVFNPLSIPRKDIVEAFIPDDLGNAESIAVFDASGKEVPSQITQGFDGLGRILFQADLPPIGVSVYSFRQAKPKKVDSELIVRKDYLENDKYKVTIDANGDISSIFDKRIRKELLEKPIQLEFGENFPEIKPAWRIYWKDIKQAARSVAAKPISVSIVEDGPLRIAVEVVRENEGSKITQRIRLSAGADGSRVEVANLIDWKSRGTLLKAAFHLSAEAPEATYNLDLGTIKRGNRNEKQYEVPHHAWLDLTDSSGEYGVSLLTGAKYGSDKVDDNTLRLTLIHSPDTRDSEQEVLDDGSMSEMRWQDWGRHQFTYALAGHQGDWREGKSHWEAMRFEQRPAAFAVPKYRGKASSFSLLQIDNDQVNIQAIKMAEDKSGVVIRLQELHGKVCKGAKLSAIEPILAAEELDGAERALNIHHATNRGKVSIDLRPYELKTMLLKIEGANAIPELTQAIELDYDTDVFSYNSNREDGYMDRTPRSEGHRGSLDGKGGTYPAEMIGDKVQLGNISFSIASREEREYNSIACLGQNIDLPEGTRVLHILAAADVDRDVTFHAGETEIPLTIGGWSGYMGSWDNRQFEGFVAELSYSMRNELKTIHPAFIRDQRIAWSASHRHLPAGDALYEYGYLFAYRIELPEGTTSIRLPDSRFVRIVAMSVGDEGYAKALQSPFEDLHRDNEFIERYTKPEALTQN
jgi:alpha-mannosidase